jgi:SSS family solute:Na+ symporter
MLTPTDYLNVGFYFAFLFFVGFVFARKNKSTSDYFRAGGVMPWWVTGASTWMAGFSAWTFTGAAAKIYETGPFVLVLYYANLLPAIVLAVFTSYRFRRLRVITPIEGVRLRFGAATQQFYTWLRLPVMLLFGALSLNAVGVFMAAVFDFDLLRTILLLGAVVIIISLAGGSMGVVASDFVQMLLIVTITMTVAVLALRIPEVGGLIGLVNQVPEKHFQWSEFARPEFIGLWFLALTLNMTFNQNSLSDEKAAKYMMAQSDRHARLMLIIPFFGALLGSLIWLVPPMAASVVFPNLAEMFPQLRYPHEGAFLAIAREVLPAGMLGLLICGIFSASLTDLGGNLNWGSGVFMRNFYLPILNPNCPEKKLLTMSRFTALVLGVLMVAVAVMISQHRAIGLFDLINQIGISLVMPLSLPIFIGLFFTRTPSWSAWSTALVGLALSFVAKFYITPESVAWIPGLGGPFLPEERTLFGVFSTFTVVAIGSTAYFFATSLFYERSSAEFRASVEDFRTRLKTPTEVTTQSVGENRGVARLISLLCAIYGGFLAIVGLFQPESRGQIAFVACGGGMLLIAGLIFAFYRRRKSEQLAN